MTRWAIEITDFYKHYGRLEAVKGISFSVREGAFFGFVGPNGAGKTTTIHAISGLAEFTRGRILVFGRDVRTEYQRTRRSVGLCGQEFNFDPYLTLFQLLVYQAGYFGVPKKTAQKRAETLLVRFGLWEKRAEEYRALSGGMKRRLLICRALIHDPEVLILDEPTAGADVGLRRLIWNYLQELNREGKTIFLTSHYMEEVEKLCGDIAVIHGGKILYNGTMESILKGGSGLESVFVEMTGGEDGGTLA